MDQTAKLDLPYIMPSQAQKHVTHNEALRLLDGLVQLSVIDRDLPDPPTAPAEGDRYLVSPGGSGAWMGWDGAVAHHADGVWQKLTPQPGWRAWVEDEGKLIAFDGSSWQVVGGIPASGAQIQNAALLGIGTAADAANPFSARVNKALWTALYTAEGGNGDLFHTMNKENAAGDVGILMQSGFVTKALMGLFGSDNWRLSVSSDGSVFHDAIRAEAGSGRIALPSNPKFVAHLNYDQYVAADSWTKVAVNSADYNDQGVFDAGTNRFTAPAAGLYGFGAAIGWKQNGANVPSAAKAKLVRNGSLDLTAPLVMPSLSVIATDGSETVLHLQAMALLATGDTVELRQLFGSFDGYVPQTVTRFWGWWVA
ncbi:DUF2793 domain-containing protein [Nitratireductor pacificus]|uniref:C1q domain-containing protein n=1 Tax=Nitratireductor pacificus pht-3B TaxID=391937 RepID=K2LQ28_9HYPH|nr:DUF2793 domain-containing protein [Nitratireductor pacificus]EKF19839.1 hypothetical protein NA2_05843 [Nitratireductor pacificus pht-3B]